MPIVLRRARAIHMARHTNMSSIRYLIWRYVDDQVSEKIIERTTYGIYRPWSWYQLYDDYVT